MISAVLIVIGAWLIVGGVLCGLGYLVRSRFGLTPADPDTLADSFWMGYAVGIASLQLWHLVFAIDWRVCLLLGIVGGYGFIRLIWQTFRKSRRVRLNGRILITILILLPIAVWVAARALDWAMDFDSGFYHFSAIRWLNTYPIVTGIGNLHYRLAFNQTFFLFVAALNVSPFFEQGHHIANSLLLIGLVTQLLGSTIYALRYPRAFTPYRLFGALLLPVILYHAARQLYSANISSPSPDLSIFLFGAVVALAFVRFLFEPDGTINQQRFTVFFIMVLSAVGITSKLSFIGFGAAAVIVALGVWVWRERQTFQAVVRRSVVYLLIVGGLIGFPWMVRGIITSGYPAFPSSVAALPVDWRIPRAITREAELWVYSFARQPNGDMDTVLSTWDWIPGWWDRVQGSFDVYLFVLPLEIGAVTVLLSLISLAIRALFRKFTHWDWLYCLPLIPAFVAGLFWFLSAPDPRFAGSAFWIWGVWGATWLLFSLRRMPPRWISVLLLIAPTLIALLIVATEYDHGTYLDEFPRVPTAPVKPYITASGLSVNISDDPNNSLQLWDAPLPASPYSLPSLQLRGTTLREGFRLSPDAVLAPP